MNRRLFILSLFAGCSIELGSAEDLRTPQRPPIPPPASTDELWQMPYCYAFSSELRGIGWSEHKLENKKDFWLTRVGWHALNGAIAEIYAGEELLGRAMIPSFLEGFPLVVPVFVPAGSIFTVKLKNREGNISSTADLLLSGHQKMTLQELTAYAAQEGEIDAEFIEEDDAK